MKKVGVWDERLLGIGYGEGITNTESPIKIGGCTKELSIGGGTKSEGYMG